MGKFKKGPGVKTAQAILEKYACPVPFHAVRTLFLGNISTPAMAVSPLEVIKHLWGGELPPFDSIEAANALLDALVQGLWNDLTRHQKRSQPFRLTRLPIEPTMINLNRYALVRREEADGFIEGLFNGNDVVELPERAHEAVGHLVEVRAMMEGIGELLSRTPEVQDVTQVERTLGHLREMTRIMETEMHEAVLSCTRARRQMLEGILTEKPTVH